MRVRDLRKAVDDVRVFFTLGGAKPQDEALGEISNALSKFDGEDAHKYLASLSDAAARAAAPPAEKHLRALQDAGLDEPVFSKALAALQADKKIKKPAIARIAREFGADFDKKASAPKLIDAIKLHFYTKLYERDSSQLARKATPV